MHVLTEREITKWLILVFVKKKIGNSVNPPNDVQDQEQFKKIQCWIQRLLQASQKILQVRCCTGFHEEKFFSKSQ